MYPLKLREAWGKSERHWETVVVASFSAVAPAPLPVDMARDDIHGMPEDDTESQMGLELTAKKFKLLQKKKCYQKRRREEDKENHAE